MKVAPNAIEDIKQIANTVGYLWVELAKVVPAINPASYSGEQLGQFFGHIALEALSRLPELDG